MSQPAEEAFTGYRKSDPEARRINLALLLAGLATFVVLYSTQAILPYFARSYDISPSQASWAMSLATAGLGCGLLVAAPLSDKLGRTNLILFSLFTSALIGVVVAVIPSWELFLTARFIQGVTLAGLPATAAVYLREEIHVSYVGAATGIYVFGTTIGGLAGRVVSSGLIELSEFLPLPDLGWINFQHEHFAMLGTAVLALLCAIACQKLLPASRGFNPNPRSFRQLPRNFLKAFTDPVLIGLYIMAALTMGTFVGIFNSMGFRLEAAPYFFSIGLVGLLYFVYPVGGVASTWAGRAADRVGMRKVMPLGVIVMLAAIFVLNNGSIIAIIAGLVLLSAGFFSVHSVASAWVAARAALGIRLPAQAASMYMLFYYACSSVSGNLTPYSFELGGWGGVTVLTSILIGVALLISVLLFFTKPVALPKL
ncbi:MFS transporter [Micrococcoides hystricis]|uniref:MFS transporter n=1 Tax=Micrococcoides hystricis TaxID=1572761 RepID=A0ABV6PAS2_9MICC